MSPGVDWTPLLRAAITVPANSGRSPSAELISVSMQSTDQRSLSYWGGQLLHIRNRNRKGRKSAGRHERTFTVLLRQVSFFMTNRCRRWLLNKCGVNE